MLFLSKDRQLQANHMLPLFLAIWPHKALLECLACKNNTGHLLEKGVKYLLIFFTFLAFTIKQKPTPQLNVFSISLSSIFFCFNHLNIFLVLSYNLKWTIRWQLCSINKKSNQGMNDKGVPARTWCTIPTLRVWIVEPGPRPQLWLIQESPFLVK